MELVQREPFTLCSSPSGFVEPAAVPVVCVNYINRAVREVLMTFDFSADAAVPIGMIICDAVLCIVLSGMFRSLFGALDSVRHESGG